MPIILPDYGFELSQWWAILLGTFASEDGTCIATALLIHERRIPVAAGLSACLIGIYVGDLLLWLAGYALGRRLLALPLIGRRLPPRRIEQLGAWLNDKGWKAILASRFLPGTRLPMYVAAGTLGTRPFQFAFWTLLAVIIWTPILIGLVVLSGPSVVEPIRKYLGTSLVSLGVATLALLLGIRLIQILATGNGLNRIVAAISRIWRWEFWPAWLFYLPVLPWIGLLSIRYRGISTITAANPAIPHGGVVGESKYGILKQLPERWVISTVLIPPDEPAQRVKLLTEEMQLRDWEFPIILKPDAGERGAGLRFIRDIANAEEHLRGHTDAIIAQTFHPGPYEAGVFYIRIPGEEKGRIFSITDKHFPFVVGDGVATISQLIWRNSRFRMQADRFLARLNGQADTVLASGERMRLAIAGNHCQGTMFRDGNHLITQELEHSIDFIAKSVDGFYFGRFDVRYGNPEEFRAGSGFSIIELNGATSESTNIYDPSWSIWRAYGVLYKQWALLFRVGNANRQAGQPATPFRQLATAIRTYYRDKRTESISD